MTEKANEEAETEVKENKKPSQEELAKVVQAISASIGQITDLMRQSRAHRHLFIADMEWLVIPPVMQRQFRIYRNGHVPVAYVSWARVNEEVEQRLKAGNVRLKPGEWNCGDRNWVIDIIAPAGKADEIIKNLQETQFEGPQLKTFRDVRNGEVENDAEERAGEAPTLN
jgi:cytolysin-activating lysine-acyltransferase